MTTSASSSGTASPRGSGLLPAVVRDGRDARWEAHRTRRRRQLVEAALRAIRKHGAGVGMDEIAAEAATSKTVLYRHLGDKASLYRAVVAAVDETILTDLEAARQREEDIVARLAAMVTSYLSMVERDPEIYRFVMTRPLEAPESGSADPVHQITDRIAEQLTESLREHLDQLGRPGPTTLAAVWGHGIVGFVQSAADHWLARQPGPEPLSIQEVSDAVVALISPGLNISPGPNLPPDPARKTP
ncbi:TetR/AcrR family transcriptional regulator [Ornithinimicrobium panacihumi]|uniref:TetR/AcrR family transcriptional regulator n=1 Tax=Ornithinimicrobium panacihumi TaxID=2008449 RepID=UPI003F8A0D8E